MVSMRIERCKNAARREAKHGKTKFRFTVYVNEVKLLEEEGFKVKVPKYFQNLPKKNLVRVTIYWDNPTTTGGLAQQCKNHVKQYCYRLNATKRNCKVKAGKQLANRQKELIDEELWLDEDFDEDELDIYDNEYDDYNDYE